MTGHLSPLSELAGRLGFKPGRLRTLCKRREIPHYRIGGRLFFSQTEIDQWLAARRLAELAGDVETDVRDRQRQRDHAAECEALGIETNHPFA